ncbi:SDR family NAD(P)-dependent oxidoreductase [Paenibacillus caseinilyticus]|uniref:SDR family NAD(P)-dependent oxidoreductase n=1 Tax=Paenibacillus caseinilyticus TaxID=3098138 RepID=UPI0022B88330|nr:SDR family NAD(P)-dependent oxidoreductase [Paenibacillus caseinilyticus]MCZ8521617.1 SDR family NAD(P)-dependent oxidoreductase [Paenibacillus caseinilyticus]
MRTEFRMGSDHPILRHHVVLGQGTLPGLAYIDLCYQWFREEGYAFRELELRQVTVYRPLTIPEGREAVLHATAAEMAQGLWHIRIEDAAPEQEADEAAGGQAFPEGSLYMSAEMHLCQPVSFEDVLDVQKARMENSGSLPVEDMYAHCALQGVRHGGIMKAGGRILELGGSVIMDLTAPAAAPEEADMEAEAFMFHPALMDCSGAGGGARFTLMNGTQALYLPLFYESFRASELMQSACLARIEASSVQRSEELLTLTIEFFHETGRKIGELTRFTNKRVRMGEGGPEGSREGDRVGNSAGSSDGNGAGNSAGNRAGNGDGNRKDDPGCTSFIGRPAGAADVLHVDSSERASARQWLRELFANRLQRPVQEISTRSGYYEMGLDSLGLLYVAKEVEGKAGSPVPPTLLFEYTTIGQLADHLAAAYPGRFGHGSSHERTEGTKSQARGAAAQAAAAVFVAPALTHDDDIAVIGMAGRYPDADSLEDFWNNLKEGRDSIREVPPSRWDWRQLGGLRSPSGKSMSRWGGFLEAPDCFDPQFFRITPREAETLDPQERLFLETCWATIEDAGYTPGTLTAPKGVRQRHPVGVFVGVMHKDYALLGAEAAAQGHPVPLSLNYAPIANRVSYFCNFHGPSMAVDTVCSSSLTAVHLAVESIRRGECEVALAGGVNLSLHPGKYATYGLMDMQSSDGRCRTFGEGGDGYVSGEGVGAVLLKPLHMAVRDGDQIYGVIKASAVNHVGTVSGITVPSPVGQADLIVGCLEKAGIDARSLSYIEAHGTGTSLGDPIEIQGLVQAFREHTEDTGFCSIGSVKSNIGHAESAAGIAGLHKVLLQLHHRTLVPSLHGQTPNPYIDFEASPFYVQQTAAAWATQRVTPGGTEKAIPRRAGISSFGATGSNAHLVVEEYIPEPAQRTGRVANHRGSAALRVLVPLSAKNADRLQAYARKLADALRSVPDADATDLQSLAYTLQVGREAMEERAVFLVRELRELQSALEALAEGAELPLHGWRSRVTAHGEEALDDSVEAQAAIRQQIAEGKLDSVAEAWLLGHSVPWHMLYGEGSPRRMSLPTYPFARERYWIPQRGPLAKGLGDAAGNSAQPDSLHPLAQRNTSDFWEQRYQSTFTGDEFFLADHRVLGQRVLPGAAYLEMVRAAVEQAAGEQTPESSRLRLQHVVWTHPLTVGREPVHVNIGLYPEAGGLGEIAYEIFSLRSVHGTETAESAMTAMPYTASEEAVVYSQGSAALVPAAEEAPRLDLEAIREACRERTWDRPAVYAAFGSMGLDYGPAHQGIEEVHSGSGEVLAYLHLPHVMDEAARGYALHPGMIDSALQACIAFQLGGGEPAAMLPYAIEELVLYGACVPRMRVCARLVSESGESGTAAKYDLDLCDESGRVLVRIRGFSVRRLEKQTLQAPAGSTGTRQVTLLLQPGWERIPDQPENAASSEPEAVHAADRREIVFLCGLPQPAVEAVEGQWDGVRCWALPAMGPSPADSYQAAAAALQERLQLELQDSGDAPLRVRLLVGGGGTARLYTGLFGMLRTLQLEQPRVSVQLIELDPAETGESAADLCRRESRAGAQGAHLRCRDGGLWLRTWKETAADPGGDPAPPWRDGGVYLITGGAAGLGLLFAREMAGSLREGTLILTGRSPLGAEKLAELHALQTAGVRVHYEQADAADRGAVEALMEKIRTGFGALHGIIHSAGVLRDGWLLQGSAEDLRDVLAPKVDGLVNLDEASSSMPLDFILAFSSAAGALGNPGQSAYAAANAFMDAYADYRTGLALEGRRSGRMLSVNWPLWQEGGMGLDPAAEKILLERHGVALLGTASGIRALARAWASGESRVLVLEGELPRLRTDFLGDIQVTRAHTQAAPQPQTDDGGSEADELREHAVHYLKKVLSAVIKLPVNRIEAEAPLEEYGMDSLVVMQMTNELEKTFGSVSKTLFFEYRTLGQLADYLVRTYRERMLPWLGQHRNAAEGQDTGSVSLPAQPQPRSARSRRTSRFAAASGDDTAFRSGVSEGPAGMDIAVIGLSGRYPGGRTLEEFWQVLREGKDCITELPGDRWNSCAARSGGNRIWGGFIEGVDEFDPQFFHISPREAETMDPQERLFLERVYEAMEDAGYVRTAAAVPGRHHTSNVGVYVGVMYEEYQLYGVQEQLQGRPVALSGNAASIANRVSYFCNFHGPSMAVATMCSSSLTALHLACQSLKQGECELAVAGGVNVSLHPNKYVLLEQGQFVSSKGRCESFGRGGDGYVPGEGVGAVLLKPLAKAVADGDPIYGVIKGTAVNHGGKVTGYTVPNPNAQADVIGRALREAGIDPRTLTYIEAHGTGTSLGDPIEIAGLTKSFEAFTQDKEFCAIGSVKSNIGHSESAAGIAGLTKVLLQMRHGELVPSLHSEELNPHIDFARTPFRVQRKLEEWKRPVLQIRGVTRELPRTAGLSSFGAGGSNAHIVIQEYIPTPALSGPGSSLPPASGPALFLLSARDGERLREQAERLLKWASSGALPPDRLVDAAFTLQVGREAMEERLALTAISVEELREKLTAYLEGREEVDGLYRDGVKRNKETLALFAQDEDMARTVESWVAKGKFAKLLDLWVKGFPVDWTRLYGGEEPRRMRLPVYPFARERYWVPGTPESSRAQVTGTAAAVLHPLVHANTSDLLEQRFSTAFTGEEFFFADHQVLGQSVLPGAAMLELARFAVEQAAGSLADEPYHLRLKQVVWSRPLAAGTEPPRVSIGLYPGDQEGIDYEIYSGLPAEDGESELFSTGRAELAAPAGVPHLDLEAIRSACSHAVYDASACYDALLTLGIRYGNGHRGIQTLYAGTGQVLAALVLPPHLASTLESYILHPSLLDSALHASIGFHLGNFDGGGEPGLSVPFALEELHILGSCTARMWAYLRYSEGSAPGGGVEKFDIDLCDGEGIVRVRMIGFSVRRLAQQGEARPLPVHLQPAETKEEGGMKLRSLITVWEAASLSSLQEQRAQPPSDGAEVLVIGESGAVREALLEHWSRASVLELPRRASVAAVAERLAAGAPLRHIVWIAPGKTPASSADEAWVEAQEDGVLMLYRLIRALLELGAGEQPLDFTLFTAGTQHVRSNEAVPAAHAAVHGLAGSMAKEYPNWQVRVLDLETGAGVPVSMLESLPADPEGGAWAYRSGEWYRQKLVEVESLPAVAETSPYRTGGVYVVIGGAGGIGEAWTEHVMRTCQAQVVWIGRRAIDDAIRAKIGRLAAIGPAPQYISADTADLASLQRAYREIKERHGEIHGIVHAALVLLDGTLAKMEEDQFRAALAAKVDVSVRLAQVFREEPLDFILFFSSFNAFARPAGQSNYSAGCAFIDSYAAALAQELPCPVKVVNWGYWGSVGAVASESYRERMARLGVGSIEPPEAMEALEQLLTGPWNQIAVMKTDRPVATHLIDAGEYVSVYPASHGIPPRGVPAWPGTDGSQPLHPERFRRAEALIRTMRSVEEGIARLLEGLLQLLEEGAQGNGYPWNKAFYVGWLKESKALLSELRGSGPSLPAQPLEALWEEWERSKALWLLEPGLEAQIMLAETVLRALPDILAGRTPATDILFPGSSMALVEGVYKHNPVADYFNEVLADSAAAYIEEILSRRPDAKLRILEIGAGTGGTSATLLRKLKPYRHAIQKYGFTDISRAFLMHAEKEYGPQHPYLSCALFNAEHSLAGQGLDAGAYDLAVATNVLHATKNIRRTLRNVKAALRQGGLLLLNEITGSDLFTHVTFGLLEGWWAYEDAAIRTRGCPALSPEAWQRVLEEEGFPAVAFPARHAHTWGQQVIGAHSNGIVRQIRLPEGGRPSSAQHRVQQIGAAGPSPGVTGAPALQTAAAAAGAGKDREILREKSRHYFKGLIGGVLKLPAHRIDSSEPLEMYGIDSILVVQLTETLRQVLDSVSSTLFFEYQTIDALTEHFIRTQEEALRKLVGLEDLPAGFPQAPSAAPGSAPPLPPAARPNRRGRRSGRFSSRTEGAQPSQPVEPKPSVVQDVAIIGLSGRFPMAESMDELWANLRQGTSCITEIPADRWNWRDYYDEHKGKSGSMYSKWGGFLKDIDMFDPMFFHISPKEAAQMDPQERLFLEAAYASIGDAGYTPASLGGSSRRVGVFAGVMNANYPTGASYWSIANRVSYLMNFQGPSMAVDTACSSSLTAIHLALESLYSGMSECAVVGGVNLIVDPVHYLRLSSAGMLSPGDTCRAFGIGADGFVDGEGVCAVVLKPLQAAEADGDHIYGILKGSALGAGGKTNGYTVPNPGAQRDVVSEAMRRAGVHPRTVSYVEAHGTGTALGDPIEIAGLSQAFGRDTGDKGFCAIGSVKSNIGHGESASGMAGLAKVLLQLQHRQLVPTLHAGITNPGIDFADTPFTVQRELAPWERPVVRIGSESKEYPRRAGISSFGAGGANAHIVVEEYVPAAREEARNLVSPRQPALIVLSAKDEERLGVSVRRLLEVAEQKGYTDADLRNIAYTLQTGREEMDERLAFCASSVEELKLALTAYLEQGHETFELYRGHVRAGKEVLSALTSDEDMQEAVDKWIRGGKYARLIDLWTKGLRLDWTKLYAEEPVRPRRMSLPTYPFARERCWVSRAPYSGAEVPRESAPSVTAASAPMTFEEVWREEELPLDQGDGSSAAPPRTLVVFLTDPERRQVLLADMRRLQPQTSLIFIGESEGGEGHSGEAYSVRAHDRGSFEAALRHIRGTCGMVDGVLYLWALERSVHVQDPTALIHLIQAVSASGLEARRIVAAGAYGDELDRCYLESWTGFARSLGNVLPRSSMTVLCAESEGSSAGPLMGGWAGRLCAELGTVGPASVLYRNGKRHTGRIRPTTANPNSSAVPVWKAGGTYLITGGLGGLGYLFAVHAAQRERVGLILTGRSPLGSDGLEKIRRLEGLGSRVEYVQGDLSDLPLMREGLARAKGRLGPILGVLHAAGVQENSNLLDKDPEGFRRVLHPKIGGTLALDELLKEEPLDYVAYFTSSSAILGDFGSCDYAVGSRFQTAYARYRNLLRSQGLRRGRAVALNWPLWRDGGMGFEDSDQGELYLKASGQRYLEKEEGLALFDTLMEGLGEQYLILAGDRVRVERFLGLADAPRTAVRTRTASFKATGQQPTSGRGRSLGDRLLDDLRRHIGALLHIAPERLDPEENMVDFGFDSISLTQFAALLTGEYGIEVTPSLIYGYPTLGKLSEYLLTKEEEALQAYYEPEEGTDPAAEPGVPTWQAPGSIQGSEAASGEANRRSNTDASRDPSSASTVSSHSGGIPAGGGGRPESREAAIPMEEVRSPRGASDESTKSLSEAPPVQEPIAVIGMSGRFPGADTVDDFWRLLLAGESAIREIPPDRWDWRDYAGDPHREPGKSRSRWGGFLSRIDQFDPLFFEIPPKEAELLDPQQRLFLEEAWHALEDAGYMGERIKGTSCGVYVGAEESQYGDVTGGGGQISSNQNATLSARIAYKLDLKGPNFALTAACSSGLVAVHQACQALRLGECDMALAGGVSLTVSPRMYAGLDKANMLSPDGTCAVFDRRANGLVPGEAVAVVVLKPLSEAIADGDRIYGTIEASGVNYDGQTNGLSAPSPVSQEQLLRQIYGKYGIRPEGIGYLLAHSVGAKVGDSIEWAALTGAFGPPAGEGPSCALGSVKPLIGHTFAASGVVSLIAMLLAMKHETILPVPGFREASELIRPERSPFYMASEPRRWSPQGNRPRIGAVSTTGISGTNAHAVIREYVPVPRHSEDRPAEGPALPEAIVLSAKNAERLTETARQLIGFLRSASSAGVSLRDIAYTLSVGREVMKSRLAFAAGTKDELIARLEQFCAAAEELPAGLSQGTGDEGSQGWGAMLEEAWSTRNLTMLASLWMKGSHVPWARLFEAGPMPAIVSLPGYPFKRRRCWASPPSEGLPAKAQAAALLPPSADEGNKTAELYSFNAMDRSTEFQEEYLTFCPFESRIPGFSMSRVMLNPELYPEEAALVKAKQVELRQVLFYKEDFGRLSRVLDIGCGHGTDVIQIASLYPHLRTHGYTISQAQAELGNERIAAMKLSGRARIFHRDSAADAFPDRYDLVMGIEVCCHIADKHALFANIAGSLQEDGTVLLMDFIANLRGPIVDPAIGIAIATADEWVEVISRQGLVIDEIVDVSPWVANYLHDPDCERNTRDLTPVARDSLRSYANNAVSLGRGWISYCLFKLRKDTVLGETERRAYNADRIASKTPYAEALKDMLGRGTIPYPPHVRSTTGDALPTR